MFLGTDDGDGFGARRGPRLRPCGAPGFGRGRGRLQHGAEKAAGVRRFDARDLLRRALRDDRAPAVPALGSQVDDVIGVFDDFQVVLDDEQRVAAREQPVERPEQLADVREVQAGGRLVEDEQRTEGGARLRVAGTFPGDVRGELEPLRLSAGQGGERLPEPHVFQAHCGQRVEAAAQFVQVGEEVERLGDRQGEDAGQVLVAVGDFQDLGAEALPAALRAGHVHVRQELHLDFLEALALARLAAPALDVERERARGIAAHARPVGLRQQLAQRVERLGVGQQVGARGGADGRLVHEDQVGQPLAAGNRPAGARNADRLAALLLEPAVDHLFDQRGLARAGHAGQAHQAAERHVDVEVAQIVRARAAHREVVALAHAPPRVGQRNRLPAGQILAGQRLLVFQQLGVRPLKDDLAAVLAGARPQVDDVVGLADDLRVVFHDHDRVAAVAQVLQDAHQPRAVARVQADGRFVQNVQRVDQRRAERGGQIDALQFAARQGARLAVERQVFDADFDQIAQPFPNLVQDQPGDAFLVRGRLQGVEERGARADAHQVHVGQRPAAHAVQQALRLEPRPAAVLARKIAAVARQEDAHVHLVGLAFQPFEPAAHPVIVVVALHDRAAVRRREVLPRHVGRDAVLLAEREQFAPLPLRGLDAPRFDGAGLERQRRVGDDQLGVDVDAAPEPAAGVARAERAVEREHVGHRLAVGDAARRAFQPVRERLCPAVVVREDEGQPSLAVVERLFARIVRALSGARGEHQPIDQHGTRLDRLARGVTRAFVQFLDRGRPAVDQQPVEAGLHQTGADVLPGQAGGRRDLEGDHEARARGPAFAQLAIDRFRGVALDPLAARAAVQGADLRVQQFEVVVQLGHGADRRTRGAHRPVLVDGDGGQDAVHALDVRLVHAVEELPRVRGEALDVAALALGVQNVEREAGLARAADAGQHRQAVERNLDVDVLEVVLAGADHADGVAAGFGCVQSRAPVRLFQRRAGRPRSQEDLPPRPSPLRHGSPLTPFDPSTSSGTTGSGTELKASQAQDTASSGVARRGTGILVPECPCTYSAGPNPSSGHRKRLRSNLPFTSPLGTRASRPPPHPLPLIPPQGGVIRDETPGFIKNIPSPLEGEGQGGGVPRRHLTRHVLLPTDPP